jgi:ribosomal protein L3
MLKLRAVTLLIVASVGLGLVGESVVYGQSSDTAASTPRQIRKTQRKAARAKKNAHLKELEKNGYQSGDTLDYPQNIQNAQKKAQEGGPAAASAP